MQCNQRDRNDAFLIECWIFYEEFNRNIHSDVITVLFISTAVGSVDRSLRGSSVVMSMNVVISESESN